MPVIKCKNDKHLVTLYNPVTFELYFQLRQEGRNMPLKRNVLENYLSDQTNTQTL